MSFNILKFIIGWFTNLPTVEAEKIVEFTKWVKEQFPDSVDQQVDELTKKLQEIVAPYEDIEFSINTLAGMARDIINGTAGTDPDAWMGSV